MLNQFYNYLSEKLIAFFEDQSLSGGERFYLQFDDENQVRQFYDALGKHDYADSFIYQHEHGSPYETFGLKIGEVTVVVAATVNHVTPDFLVTLRNKVGEQQEDWENTALLSICHETLDSIRGGSSDLQKEGMPFHVKSITNTLKQEIENSSLSKTEKEIAKFHLNKKLEDIILQPALVDFAEVLGLLSQGSIEKKDYPSLGLFYDEQLDQYTPSQVRKRLEENHSYFEKVQHIHEYENLEQQLEKSFDDKGVTQLKKDDWQALDYSFVKESNERLIEEDKKVLEYIEMVDKQTKEGLVFWEKPIRDTKAGNRKRHIIIFNPERKEEINLQFSFDEFLKQEFIKNKTKAHVEKSGKKLNVQLFHDAGNTTFYKFTYQHKNQTKSTYDFQIAIVECPPTFLEPIQTLYEVKQNEKRIIIHGEGNNVFIGQDQQNANEYDVEEPDEVIELASEEEGIEISEASAAWSDDSLKFTIKINEYTLPFKIKDQLTRTPAVLGKQIWKMKRERKAHFTFENDQLQQGTLVYHPREEFKRYLQLEKMWMNQGMHFAKLGSTGLEAEYLNIPSKLKDAYEHLLDLYRSKHLLPSLAYLEDQLLEQSKKYVDIYNSCVRAVEENSILTKEEKNIFKLGTIEEANRIYLTPLHPLNVAYQIAFHEQISGEQLEHHILDRLRPNNLLPYVFGNQDELYRPIIQHHASEWVVYEPLKNVTVGESNAYLANVVEEKLQQFVEHFSYLFLTGSNSPFKINVINITNDEEVLRGIFYFVKKRIEKYGPHQVIPLDIALYQENDYVSAFETFSLYDDVESIEERFDISLESKKLDPADMLRFVRENIRYYKLKDTEDYNYAHISFYKMISQDSYAKDNIQEMETGLSLHGLLSSVTSATGRQDYRTGFGIKNVLEPENQLIETAYCLNELASNLENEGSSPYRKNEAIVTRTTSFKEETLDALYDSSYWVTFIDPNVDLDFFQRSERDLLIIHYSDQYSYDQYDAITVTDKSSQYRKVIKQYLEDEYIKAEDDQINLAIRAFNAVNGEWLLRIIGSKAQFSREKLSIISALKYALSFLDHERIIWIPISLEEILRVAGVVNLTKSAGIFSAKNLGVKGSTSDDLLLIGLEITEDQKVYFHYYPVEVKVGLNQSSTIAKAKEQISTTRSLLDEQLKEVDENGDKIFKNAFFRNFFVQLFLANAQKFLANGLWPEKNFEDIEKVKDILLNDSYQVGNHLRPNIGDGMVLSFKNEATWRSAKIEDRSLLLQLSEEDAYSGVIEEVETIKSRIHQGKTDINTNILLANNYGQTPQATEHAEPVTDEKKEPETKQPNEKELSKEKTEKEKKPVPDNEDPVQPNPEEEKDEQPVDLEDVRVLLGTVEGSKHKVYWEYGHKDLANRHILISGKSGQGKTYFMQCMLMELAANNVSSIIFDYTGGFKKSKLEPEFKEFLGDKLEQILVARDNFPINPFKRNEKELDEDEFIEEDFADVADRMKSVFAAIYTDLGIQQLNAIYQAIVKGMQKHGDSMNLELLRQELEEDNSGSAKTALSQLNPMIDKNPFDSSHDFNWGKLEEDKGKVLVIQLTGFASDVQKMITEFILWDLWHYKLQHGDQTIPMPVVLDEAQNLDHSEKSPSAKILTEGRKFGWSGWYATQFLKGQLNTDEIARLQNSSQKIYFLPPENEISTVASNLSHDNASKREWERRLAALNKAQCVSYGPMLGKDGSLRQSEPVIVNISSLEERIRLLGEKEN
ncbi:hypothetical protein GCM10008986_18950 [Salinibacillus aidingensis]|uniref:Helicase HerA central domain-containing protein n=1 Tax=Salinibacillus aidingensis TaxID=237684 RepID=A0ABN1B915_9BACI